MQGVQAAWPSLSLHNLCHERARAVRWYVAVAPELAFVLVLLMLGHCV